jgi:hypothetical protein
MIVVYDRYIDVFDLVIGGQGHDQQLNHRRDEDHWQQCPVSEDLAKLFLQQKS